MSQQFRLDTGGRINRQNPIQFTFNGKRYGSYEGDTLASGLLANGVTVVSRSFKYHRPRGIVGSGTEDPSAVVQVNTGAETLPNLRATEVELYDGLKASSLNCWPSVNFDVAAGLGLFSKFLPPGFYYKTFMWPKNMWKVYEYFIRKGGGLGISPKEPDPDHYDKINIHCDVLVVGGGPAGLAAALQAGRSGARVIIADEQNEFGGQLLSGRELIDGAPAMKWVSSIIGELAELKEVRLFPRSTVFGYYDHNFLALIQRLTNHLKKDDQDSPRERIWRIRAKQVILATGAIERPLIFPNNDRPGVMLASAVSTYLNRYAVISGIQPLIFTNNDSAYQTALDLDDVGNSVVAVVDVRPEPSGTLPTKVRQRGIPVIAGHAIVDVDGGKRVKSVEIMPLDSVGKKVKGSVQKINCDLVPTSGGWNPVVHLHCQSGGKTRFDTGKSCFVPWESVQSEISVGSANGSFKLKECLAEGLHAGSIASDKTGFPNSSMPVEFPTVSEECEEPLRTMWLVPARAPSRREHKQFVDLQEDVTVGDIELAAREGYDSIPLLSRYTTLGFGTDQGKIGNINGMGILGETLGEDIQCVGTTTYRPPFTPITFGAIAGSDVGHLHDPVRKTPMHPWHVKAGAKFENVEQWKRPWFYPRENESMNEAVNRECLAVRNTAGLLDQSTLGKIDIKGPDAAEFLDRIYTNNWSDCDIGRCRYGLMLGEDGMVMDDGIAARLGKFQYMIYTTSSGAAKVMSWLERWLQTEWADLKVYLTSVTEHWATMSVVGPYSRKIITKLSNMDFSSQSFPFLSYKECTIVGVPARIFRISFSGEMSYEINVCADYGLQVWEAVIAAGKEYGITVYGTEAMHVLRAEKGFVIVGQDTDGSVTPGDLGMDWIVSKRKDFLGKRSLSRPNSVQDDRKQLVGLLTNIPSYVLPEGGQIVDGSTTSIPVPMVGHVTSSYFSACLGRSIALALVKGGRNLMGNTVYIPLNNAQSVSAVITEPVFYDHKGSRQNG